jgi:prevent-host-death family protein
MLKKWRYSHETVQPNQAYQLPEGHAAEIVRKLTEHREPLVITQSGEAKVVIQDIKSYGQTRETMALLKILALGDCQTEEGKVQPAKDVIKRLRERQGAH